MRRRLPAAKGFLVAAMAAATLCCWMTPAQAGDDRGYDPRVAELVTPGDFPDQGAVVLIDRKFHKFTLEATEIRRTFAIKLLTREGIEDFGDFVTVPFAKDLKYEIKAVVVSPDGERKEVESKHKKLVKIGKHYRQYRIAFPGLEPGSIIESYQKIRYDGGLPVAEWDFGNDVPTLRSELVYVVPAGALVSFSFTPTNYAPQPRPVRKDEYEIYTTTFEMLPPYVDEPYMPRRYVGNPSVFYNMWQFTQVDWARFKGYEGDERLVDWLRESNIPLEVDLPGKDWASIGKLFYRDFEHSGWSEDDDEKQCDAALEEIVSGYESAGSAEHEPALAKIVADFHDRFRPIEGDIRRLSPGRALVDEEGSPFELAYLLKLILEELDYEANIVLAGDADEGLLEEGNPDPSSLRHPLVLVDIATDKYWIDPFAPECGLNQLPWQCQGVRALWLKDWGQFSFITTPRSPAARNSLTRREKVTIGARGGLSGQSSIYLTGQYVLNIRRNLQGAEATGSSEPIQALLSELYSRNAAVSDVAIEVDSKDSLVVTCTYTLDNFAGTSGGFMDLDFSRWCVIPVRDAFESETRQHEIMFPFPSTRSSTIELTLPPGYTMEHMPENTDYTDEWFAHQRLCYDDGTSLVFTRTFAINSLGVEQKDYARAREAVEKIQKSERETVVLKQGH